MRRVCRRKVICLRSFSVWYLHVILWDSCITTCTVGQWRWRSRWPAYSSRGSATETYATSLYPRTTKQSGSLSRRCYRHLHSKRTCKTIPKNTKTEITTYSDRNSLTQFAARTCYARRTEHIYTAVTICSHRDRIPTENVVVITLVVWNVTSRTAAAGYQNSGAVCCLRLQRIT